MSSLNHKSIETRLFINNEFRSASDGKTFQVINPANKQGVADVPEATAQDVNDAVAAAKAAFPAWSKMSPKGSCSHPHHAHEPTNSVQSAVAPCASLQR